MSVGHIFISAARTSIVTFSTVWRSDGNDLVTTMHQPPKRASHKSVGILQDSSSTSGAWWLSGYHSGCVSVVCPQRFYLKAAALFQKPELIRHNCSSIRTLQRLLNSNTSSISVPRWTQWPKWLKMKIFYQHCFNIYWRQAGGRERLCVPPAFRQRQGADQVTQVSLETAECLRGKPVSVLRWLSGLAVTFVFCPLTEIASKFCVCNC